MKPSFEDMQLRLAMMASIPSLLVMLGVLCMSDLNSNLKWLIASLSTAFVSYCLFILHRRLNDQFVSLANLVEALNIGDFSLRVKTTAGESGHSDLVHQLNRLADALTAARFDYKESQLLLAKLIKQIGVIIFACDDNNKLTLANPAAESAFGKTESKLMHLTLDEIGLAHLMQAPSNQIVNVNLSSGAPSRWHLYRDGFREGGKQHTLFILSDMETLLSRQEQKAWKDLVRVLSHEINNSLSPIVSLASTLNKLSASLDIDQESKEDFQDGLLIIGERAERLKSFIQGYRHLASLPEPNKQKHDLANVMTGCVELLGYQCELAFHDEGCFAEVDVAQLEQCFINILKNAYEAAPDKPVTVTMSSEKQHFIIRIKDQGTGISNPDNVFVPLYTTKKQGTGTGLALCRQIVLAHNGHISLSNDPQGGCVAEIKLPVS